MRYLEIPGLAVWTRQLPRLKGQDAGVPHGRPPIARESVFVRGTGLDAGGTLINGNLVGRSERIGREASAWPDGPDL